VIFALSNDISHGLWGCVCLRGLVEPLTMGPPAATHQPLGTLLFL
jgi:hypothetical protein